MTKLKKDLNKLMKTDGVADAISWYESGMMTLDDVIRVMVDVAEKERLKNTR